MPARPALRGRPHFPGTEAEFFTALHPTRHFFDIRSGCGRNASAPGHADLLRRKVFRSTPDANRYRSALVDDTGDINGPAVQLHQLVNERQPDSRALRCSRLSCLPAMESLEHAREIGF